MGTIIFFIFYSRGAHKQRQSTIIGHQVLSRQQNGVLECKSVKMNVFCRNSNIYMGVYTTAAFSMTTRAI